VVSRDDVCAGIAGCAYIEIGASLEGGLTPIDTDLKGDFKRFGGFQMRCQVALTFLCCFASTAIMQAQKAGENAANWQKRAGDTITFEVASVREDQGPFKPPSFAISADESFEDPSGRFHADFPLIGYIEFSYKILLTSAERSEILAKLPVWVKTDRFAIEAVAPLHATKDQYRLMMQALLADRFGLKLHFERKEVPVLAMTLTKPGKTGLHLTPHELGQACDEKPKPETYPLECHSLSAKPSKDGMFLFGSRAISMGLIGDFFATLGSSEITRRVVDRTGLTGLWDFTMEIVPPWQQASQASTSSAEPAVLEAIHSQLGIDLKPERAMVSLPVVDHLERLSEN
jgi:uncharacterized protein (TIGR03435 family)